MSRRPSVLSVNTLSPILVNGQANPSPVRHNFSPKAATGTKRPTHFDSASKLPNDNSNLDPDELFTRHTVAEVKVVQQQLRADADAKQEELRLMVGERYRDLLQASTSIISIARSSKRVMEALEETKDVILAQEAPPLPRRLSVHGNDDTHLHTLQLLSAHMKLLLDAPEHLWRLIERKKYFPAAWLFLLARVVHRALVRDDEQDEETWSRQGLDVLEQFPLVQRQWDVVSQFRSQIIHKATMFLREHNASIEDTCATLLTLHLLDSRPLTETLSVLLGQRSKTLHTLLSWTSESSECFTPHTNSYSRQTNGYVPEKSKHDKPKTGFRRLLVSEVKQATQTALAAISQTVKVARSIFQDDSAQASMIGVVLEYIQSDSPDPSAHSKMLPSELRLTTQTLLTTLPSSAHFLLLPPNLRLYKPYVDRTSSSSLVPQAQFATKLDGWFRKSTKSLQVAVDKWFSDLQSVKEVWNIRLSIRRCIGSSLDLGEKESLHLKSIFDDVCHKRVIGIWILALGDAGKDFQDQLNSAASGLREGSDVHRTDSSSVEFLFQAPPLPVLSQAGLGPVDTSFQKYKAMLRRQLIGRTSLLNDALTVLEKCARALRQDLSHVLAAGGDDAPILVEKLMEAYRPDAESLCSNVVGTLDTAAGMDAEDSASINSLVFIGRVAHELASQSSFVSDVGCGENVAIDFRRKTKALHDRIIDRWRRHTISQTIREHRLAFRPSVKAFPSTPSSGLVKSLLSLSDAIQQLGASRVPTQQNDLVDRTLRLFITNLVGDGWELDGLQTLYDLEFLRRLADIWGVGWLDIRQLLGEQTLRVREMCHLENTTGDDIKLKRGASEYLAGTQILFGTLLPHPIMASVSAETTDKFGTLLAYGSPALDQKFHSAIELAKPSSRFGLLLVGGSNPNR